jgi:peroxiredoxin
MFMTLVESVDLPLGSKMPSFKLKDALGRDYDSDELFGPRGLLVVFTCNHCPYANAQWPRLVKLARWGWEEGIHTVAINANINPDYPDDAPDKMPKKMEELGIDFPYLVDESQEVARAFKAQCTPDPYLYDREKRLVYHGRIDDNWKDEKGVGKEELKEAMAAMAAGEKVDTRQNPSMGCSIKWRRDE